MSSDVLNPFYSDSGKNVKKGDYVYFDNSPGRIEEICMPGTQLADDYFCEDSGGLLILFDDGVLTLVPFGHHHRIIERVGGGGLGLSHY